MSTRAFSCIVATSGAAISSSLRSWIPCQPTQRHQIPFTVNTRFCQPLLRRPHHHINLHRFIKPTHRTHSIPNLYRHTFPHSLDRFWLRIRPVLCLVRLPLFRWLLRQYHPFRFTDTVGTVLSTVQVALPASEVDSYAPGFVSITDNEKLGVVARLRGRVLRCVYTWASGNMLPHSNGTFCAYWYSTGTGTSKCRALHCCEPGHWLFHDGYPCWHPIRIPLPQTLICVHRGHETLDCCKLQVLSQSLLAETIKRLEVTCRYSTTSSCKSL